VLVLDERHQVHVVLALDDEDALAGVTVRVRMLQNVEQVETSIWKTMYSNPMLRFDLSFAFFASFPGEVLHSNSHSTTCAFKAHVGIKPSVPRDGASMSWL
jgi:hypothetical protein